MEHENREIEILHVLQISDILLDNSIASSQAKVLHAVSRSEHKCVAIPSLPTYHRLNGKKGETQGAEIECLFFMFIFCYIVNKTN